MEILKYRGVFFSKYNLFTCLRFIDLLITTINMFFIGRLCQYKFFYEIMYVHNEEWQWIEVKYHKRE